MDATVKINIELIIFLFEKITKTVVKKTIKSKLNFSTS